MDLGSSSALVSGGGSGLGAATARALSENGARVVVLDRDEGGAKQVAAEVGGAYVAGDVTDPEDCAEAVALASSGPPLRVAACCAGVVWGERVLSRDGRPHDAATFERVLRINVLGTFNILRLAASAMAKTEPLGDGARGVIVTTSSVAAFEGQVGQLAYSASKAAIVGMTLPAARDLAVVGIRVCTIAPGAFDTPMVASLPQDLQQALGESALFPRSLGKPEHFAELVISMVSNDFMNAEMVRLDGGLRLSPK
ncbi:MAG: SDR family NAD(P)-dependent oxidoreductase [Acidimicrobiales bacterium]